MREDVSFSQLPQFLHSNYPSPSSNNIGVYPEFNCFSDSISYSQQNPTDLITGKKLQIPSSELEGGLFQSVPQYGSDYIGLSVFSYNHSPGIRSVTEIVTKGTDSDVDEIGLDV